MLKKTRPNKQHQISLVTSINIWQVFITQTDSFKSINLSKVSDSFCPPLSLIWTGCSIARKHTWASTSNDCATEMRVFATYIRVLSALSPNLPASCCILGYFSVPPSLCFLQHFRIVSLNKFHWLLVLHQDLQTPVKTSSSTHRDQAIT